MCMTRLRSFFFFFSSRRRHTRCSRDWSSDVCSSDLILSDTVKVRELLSDGTYRRRTPGEGEPLLRSQIALQHLAREAAREGTDVRPPFVPIVRRPSLRTPHGEPAPA